MLIIHKDTGCQKEYCFVIKLVISQKTLLNVRQQNLILREILKNRYIEIRNNIQGVQFKIRKFQSVQPEMV